MSEGLPHVTQLLCRVNCWRQLMPRTGTRRAGAWCTSMYLWVGRVFMILVLTRLPPSHWKHSAAIFSTFFNPRPRMKLYDVIRMLFLSKCVFSDVLSLFARLAKWLHETFCLALVASGRSNMPWIRKGFVSSGHHGGRRGRWQQYYCCHRPRRPPNTRNFWRWRLRRKLRHQLSRHRVLLHQISKAIRSPVRMGGVRELAAPRSSLQMGVRQVAAPRRMEMEKSWSQTRMCQWAQHQQVQCMVSICAT